MKTLTIDTLANTLQGHPESLSLQEILGLLGPGASERSVRRWLQQLHADGLIEIEGNRRSTRYRLSGPAAHGLSALDYIQQPLFMRQPKTYDRSWLDRYQPNVSQYFSEVALEQLQEEGVREPVVAQAGIYARQIYNRLLIDLSYNSARLEGNTYSLLETEQLLLSDTPAEGKLNEETVMIKNHKEAIRFMVDQSASLEPSADDIRTIHYLLSEGLVPQQYAGQVRDHGVRISGSSYVPLEDRERLNGLLDEICKKAAQIRNPFEQSLFLLAHIAYLQAFIDVNKRTARLSANIPLIKNNRVPLSFNEIGKDDYLAAMVAVYELHSVEPLAALYQQSYQRTAKLYDVTAESMGVDFVRVQYRQQRREIIRNVIAQMLVGTACDRFIEEEVKQRIPPAHQSTVISHLNYDLAHLGMQHVVGMGISKEQLAAWVARALSH